MVKISRWLKHLFMPPWAWRSVFPQRTLDAIERAIHESETHHHGEIRFAIETSLAPLRVWRGIHGRDRAIEVFADLRVWDTEHNSGVLIYVLLADHDIEIVADRGIARRVSQAQWDAIAQTMEAAFRQGEFERGSLEVIAQAGALLSQHFPPQGDNPNELQNRPVIIRR